MAARAEDKEVIFASYPVPKAIFTMAVPTVISQLINLIYNIVDTFYIGRTGNSTMMAAASLALTLVMLNTAFSNLFGIGGGSLIARLMGVQRYGDVRKVSAFSCYGAIAVALSYSLLTGLFMNPLLRFLGASPESIGFARQYVFLVIVAGSLPSLLSLTLAHLLRNTGFSKQASIGLSGGGLLNIVLDPLFMFVILPPGQEVFGAALATLLSNVAACIYLLFALNRASLSIRWKDARAISRENVKKIFSVGISSAILTGLFDLANVAANKLAAGHSDQTLAALGIVMKVERVPNAINIGLCQGMMPIVAYNFSAGNRERLRSVLKTGISWGLGIAAIAIVLFRFFAEPVTRAFMLTTNDAALATIAAAAGFLRIRCLASPVQFLNFASSFSMQGMGDGKRTVMHAAVRELIVYIPLMILLDSLFGEKGLASALPIAEAISAVLAVFLLLRSLKRIDNR